MFVSVKRLVWFIWLCFLAILFLASIVNGTFGDVLGFWFATVLGLPTVLLNKKWTTGLKAGVTTIFFLVFVAFGIYSITPAGKRAYVANQRESARQDAAQQEAEDKQQAHQATLQVQAKPHSQAAQRESTRLKMPVVTGSSHLDSPNADAAKVFVQRAYPGCTVQSDMYWSGGDNDKNIGFDVTKPNGKKVVAYCQFAPDPGQADDARYPAGYYNLSEEAYQTPAQQEASIGKYSTPATPSAADQPQSSVSDEERKISAYMMAQEFVNDKLKAPGSAKYAEYDDNFVETLGDNTYQVSAFVDSQNGFGALLRLNWVVVLHDKGDGTWACKHLTMKEQ